MTVSQLLCDAIRPIVPEIMPEPYDGDGATYCTYQITELPALFADGWPGTIRYHTYLHLYLPTGTNPIRLKARIAEALWAAGTTYPSIVDASDKEGQHFVFEFEIGGMPNGDI